MNTYIDYIQRRKNLQGDKFDMRKIDKVITALQNSESTATLHQRIDSLLPDKATELQILQTLCEVLYAVHYLAGTNDLPLDDAYSAMLIQGTIADKPDSPASIQNVLEKYRSGKLTKAPSPVESIIRAFKEVETEKLKEIASLRKMLKQQAAELAEFRAAKTEQ